MNKRKLGVIDIEDENDLKKPELGKPIYTNYNDPDLKKVMEDPTIDRIELVLVSLSKNLFLLFFKGKRKRKIN